MLPSMIILPYPPRSPSSCLPCIGVTRRTSLLSTKLVHLCGCMYKARKNNSIIAQRKKKQTQDLLATPSRVMASEAPELTKPLSSPVAAVISQHAPCMFDIRIFADGMHVAALVAQTLWHPVECPETELQAATNLHIASSSSWAALEASCF